MENILSSIFPTKCLSCSKVASILCRDCLAKARLLLTDLCIICDQPSPLGFTHKKCSGHGFPDRFISVFEYEGIVRECIKNSKYGGRRFQALCLLTEYGLNLLNKNLIAELKLKVDLVACIPLSPKKSVTRGFNQAEIIAKKVARYIGKPFVKELLLRRKTTDAQFKFGRSERYDNVKGAFELNAKYPAKLLCTGKKVLLVDDISTSGATMIESGKVLKEIGFPEVVSFSLSKRLIS